MKTREDIKQSVVNQLAWDARVNANNINVKVDDGTVVLTGSVPNYSARFAANDVAWAVTGVTGVQNELDVEFPETMAVPEDDVIQRSVEQRLSWSTDTDEEEISVNVTGGLVTLEGTVPTFWQKMEAEREARNAAGVVALTNKIAVVPTKAVTDQVIAERIMDRIDQNTLAIPENVDVQIENGKVTIYGTLPSWSVWRAVYDAVQFTAGVKEIEDRTEIKYSAK